MTKVSKAVVKQQASQKHDLVRPIKQDHRTLPRQRPVKACWPCHFRKVKCDFRRPRCTYCLEHDGECTWDNRYYDRLRKGPKGRKKIKTSRQVTPELKQDSEDSHSDKCAADAVCTPLSPNEQGASAPPIDVVEILDDMIPETDSPATVDNDSSDSTDRCLPSNPSNMEIIQRVTPDRDQFCSLNSFMAVVERLRRMDTFISPASLSIEEISRLHVLWDEYVYRRPMGGQLVVANTTNRSFDERMAFYNTACAIIGLAHGAMYLRNGSCQSVMQLAGEVAWALAEEMVRLLEVYNDEITVNFIGALFFAAKIAVYNGSAGLHTINRYSVLNRFVLLAEMQNRGKPLRDICYDLHLNSVARIIFDRESTANELIRELNNLIARRRSEVSQFPPREGWPWERHRAYSSSSLTSTQIIIIMFMHKTVEGGRTLIPFDELTPALQVLVHNQIAELREGRARLEDSGATHPPGVALLSHTIGMLGYLLHYAGLISDMEALEIMKSQLEIILNDNVMNHPFNHVIFNTQYLLMSGVFQLDPISFFELVKPHQLPLQDPRLTAHGAALNHYLHLIESSHDGGVEATRNLAGLDGVRLFSTPIVRMVGQELAGSDHDSEANN